MRNVTFLISSPFSSRIFMSDAAFLICGIPQGSALEPAFLYASTFVVGTHTISFVHISSCCKESLSQSSFTHKHTHTRTQIHQ